MRRFTAGLILACALAACGQPTHSEIEARPQPPASTDAAGFAVADQERNAREEVDARSRGMPSAAPAPSDGPVAQAGENETFAADAVTPPARAPILPTGPAPVLYLAYTYAVGLEIPSQRLAGVMDAH